MPNPACVDNGLMAKQESVLAFYQDRDAYDRSLVTNQATQTMAENC